MPSSYINSDNIGNVYLNRLDGSVLQGESIPYLNSSTLSGDAIRELFTVKFTDTRTIWTPSATSGTLSELAIRFPVSWETLTGNIPAPSIGGAGITNNARFTLGVGLLDNAINTSNTSANVSANRASSGTVSHSAYLFAVVNDYAFAWCSFSSTARTSCSFGYLGWLRNDSGGSGGRYTGSQFPRNACSVTINDAGNWTGGGGGGRLLKRVNLENVAGAVLLYSTNDATFNPAINCVGDSTPLIFRDAASPFARVGMPYHLFRIPSSCTIGQVYKMATDPDSSNKPYVICCGNWGSFKVGMRLWADGYT